MVTFFCWVSGERLYKKSPIRNSLLTLENLHQYQWLSKMRPGEKICFIWKSFTDIIFGIFARDCQKIIIPKKGVSCNYSYMHRFWWFLKSFELVSSYITILLTPLHLVSRFFESVASFEYRCNILEIQKTLKTQKTMEKDFRNPL